LLKKYRRYFQLSPPYEEGAFAMTFQKRLKETRQARHISIRRLCSDLKIQKSTYENWEISVYPSRPEFYKRLADYLEVPLEYLMFGERKNAEWDMAFYHLRRYVEEVIELKLSQTLDQPGSNKTEILGQGRGLLSQQASFSRIRERQT
jgi:transcriptional regulator with XRE-family HTH domain